GGGRGGPGHPGVQRRDHRGEPDPFVHLLGPRRNGEVDRMNADALSARSRLAYGTAGMAGIAPIAFLLLVGIFPSTSGPTDYTASFARAGEGLDKRSDVKIRGITVGGVESVQLAKDGRATVRFRVDSGVRLATTTVVSIEPSSVFGPKDIDLDLGAGETTGP